ncbi:GNAT family N-acetyltransferase [Pedobacter sandarakinus]|uniref:GNAT family N-acetyltransferase n=1 Tax=Pedobacter sandarakinus TaxID=353156 RepID=UPI0022471CF1|nr:GNAT family N-acetyltransferase [Pedobacter sandarakinus]MCX2574652.1 GNAT family N-acetyltransferase [Pedobacter sandarakinus]
MRIFAETKRLIIREIVPEDIDGMFELDADPEVHKYLGAKPFISKDQSLDMITSIRQQYIEHGIGRWAIIHKETNQFAGWSGLKFVTELTNKHQNYYDLGYRLLKRFWGKGIATEAGELAIHYAFNKLKTTDVYAMADGENKASNKILTKLGLRKIEEFDLAGINHNWYRMGLTDYQSINKLDNPKLDISGHE